MNKYAVKTTLEVTFEVPMGKSDTREDAIEVAKGYLFEKIAHGDVRYNELKGQIVPMSGDFMEGVNPDEYCEECGTPLHEAITLPDGSKKMITHETFSAHCKEVMEQNLDLFGNGAGL